MAKKIKKSGSKNRNSQTKGRSKSYKDKFTAAKGIFQHGIELLNDASAQIYDSIVFDGWWAHPVATCNRQRTDAAQKKLKDPTQDRTMKRMRKDHRRNCALLLIAFIFMADFVNLITRNSVRLAAEKCKMNLKTAQRCMYSLTQAGYICPLRWLHKPGAVPWSRNTKIRQISWRIFRFVRVDKIMSYLRQWRIEQNAKLSDEQEEMNNLQLGQAMLAGRQRGKIDKWRKRKSSYSGADFDDDRASSIGDVIRKLF